MTNEQLEQKIRTLLEQQGFRPLPQEKRKNPTLFILEYENTPTNKAPTHIAILKKEEHHERGAGYDLARYQLPVSGYPKAKHYKTLEEVHDELQQVLNDLLLPS